MSPRYWTVSIKGHTLSVVAGTREAAEKIAAHRLVEARLKETRDARS